MKHSPRHHRNYVAFVGHRLSGIALAVFLPLHFLTLGMALEGGAEFGAFLSFAENPVVKVAEWGLVILLAIHLFFGARLLVLELTPWRSDEDDRGSLVGWGAGGAIAVGLIFLWGAF